MLAWSSPFHSISRRLVITADERSIQQPYDALAGEFQVRARFQQNETMGE